MIPECEARRGEQSNQGQRWRGLPQLETGEGVLDNVADGRENVMVKTMDGVKQMARSSSPCRRSASFYGEITLQNNWSLEPRQTSTG